MEYLIILFVIAVVIWAALIGRRNHNNLKKIGIKVSGLIIRNDDKNDRIDFYRFGGNINKPTVKFVTREGREIIGFPVLGFVSQDEIVPPLPVNVFYDPQHPETFCIDLS